VTGPLQRDDKRVIQATSQSRRRIFDTMKNHLFVRSTAIMLGCLLLGSASRPTAGEEARDPPLGAALGTTEGALLARFSAFRCFPVSTPGRLRACILRNAKFGEYAAASVTGTFQNNQLIALELQQPQVPASGAKTAFHAVVARMEERLGAPARRVFLKESNEAREEVRWTLPDFSILVAELSVDTAQTLSAAPLLRIRHVDRSFVERLGTALPPPQ
jgi:hypothetical protein